MNDEVFKGISYGRKQDGLYLSANRSSTTITGTLSGGEYVVRLKWGPRFIAFKQYTKKTY